MRGTTRRKLAEEIGSYETLISKYVNKPDARPDIEVALRFSCACPRLLLSNVGKVVLLTVITKYISCLLTLYHDTYNV